MDDKSPQENVHRTRPGLLRIVWDLLKASGFIPTLVVFLVLFFISSVVVDIAEPGVRGFGDACWFMFQVVTTVGLGDLSCTSVAGRIATVILSIYSVFFLAVVTGILVNFCNERLKLRANESLTHFMYQLEHLDELTKSERRELSEKVRLFRQKRHG